LWQRDKAKKLFTKAFTEEKLTLHYYSSSHPVEKFYASIGGIVGYQARMLGAPWL
jgi:hypothetical protein